MTAPEKIRKIKVKFEIDSKRLAYLSGIKHKRFVDLENEIAKPLEKELFKIDRIYKVLKMLYKPKCINQAFQAQDTMIKGLRYKMMSRVETLPIESKTEIERYCSDIIIESMYLGLMFANNNEDETVLKKVKERRK